MENPHPNATAIALMDNGAFTVAAVQADEETAGMESEFEQVNTELLAAQRKYEDLEIGCRKAEGKLSQADHGKNGVDRAVGEFELALLSLVGKKRKDVRYQRYFKNGLVGITRVNMRTRQPGEVAILLKKMGEDLAAAETEGELKGLLALHQPRIEAGALKVKAAIGVLEAAEGERDDYKDVTIAGLKQEWVSERQVLHANLAAKFPHDMGRVEAYFKPFSGPKMGKKRGGGGGDQGEGPK